MRNFLLIIICSFLMVGVVAESSYALSFDFGRHAKWFGNEKGYDVNFNNEENTATATWGRNIDEFGQNRFLFFGPNDSREIELGEKFELGVFNYYSNPLLPDEETPSFLNFALDVEFSDPSMLHVLHSTLALDSHGGFYIDTYSVHKSHHPDGPLQYELQVMLGDLDADWGDQWGTLYGRVITNDVAPVPEPGTIVLLGLGLGILGFAVRKNRMK